MSDTELAELVETFYYFFNSVLVWTTGSIVLPIGREIKIKEKCEKYTHDFITVWKKTERLQFLSSVYRKLASRQTSVCSCHVFEQYHKSFGSDVCLHGSFVNRIVGTGIVLNLEETLP